MQLSTELKKLIKVGETESVEFKSTLQKEVLETAVALANTKGGYIFVGVNDVGKIIGFKLDKEILQQFQNKLKLSTEPSLVIDAMVYSESGKTVAVLHVNEFPIKPVSLKGRYYKRIGNSNHLMSLTEVANLHLQSLQLSWDAYPAYQLTLGHLSSKKINYFLEKVNQTGRFNLNLEYIAALKKIDLITEDGQATNAAKLLFANDLSQYTIHVGRFKTPDMIIDDKIIKTTLFEAVDETMSYLISWFKVAFEITGETTQRTEIFEYPLPAIRELVLNAIVHRDYN